MPCFAQAEPVSSCCRKNCVGGADSQWLPRWFAPVGQNDRRETTFFCPLTHRRLCKAKLRQRRAGIRRIRAGWSLLGFAEERLL